MHTETAPLGPLYTDLAVKHSRYTEINAHTDDSAGSELYIDIASPKPQGVRGEQQEEEEQEENDTPIYTEIKSIQPTTRVSEAAEEGNNIDGKEQTKKKPKSKAKKKIIEEEADLALLLKQTDAELIKDILLTHAKDHRAHLYVEKMSN